MATQPPFLPLQASQPMKTKHRSAKISNHITKELRHKHLSFGTVETWFCYMLPKICLDITKTVLKRTSKGHMSSFLPPGPVLCASSFPSHTSPGWEHRCPSSLAIFPVCPLQGQLGSPLHFLMTWFCTCQWHWLDFDFKLLFVPTLTSDISLLNPSTDVIPNEHSVTADTTLDSCFTISISLVSMS